MGESKHTVGPWHVFRDEINDRDGLTVARVVQFVPLYREQSDANALLIAAAPALLVACKALVDTCTTAPPVELVRRLGEVVEQCATAIAKAEGRS